MTIWRNVWYNELEDSFKSVVIQWRAVISTYQIYPHFAPRLSGDKLHIKLFRFTTSIFRYDNQIVISYTI